MNSWYLIAALMALLTCLIHVVLGGRELVRPLLADNTLPRVVRLTHYYCWHLVTIALALMSIGLGLAAWSSEFSQLGTAATLMALLFGLLNLGYGLRYRLPVRVLPQWLLFAAISIPGIVAF